MTFASDVLKFLEARRGRMLDRLGPYYKWDRASVAKVAELTAIIKAIRQQIRRADTGQRK